jgi:hypothetical protein
MCKTLSPVYRKRRGEGCLRVKGFKGDFPVGWGNWGIRCYTQSKWEDMFPEGMVVWGPEKSRRCTSYRDLEGVSSQLQGCEGSGRIVMFRLSSTTRTLKI